MGEWPRTEGVFHHNSVAGEISYFPWKPGFPSSNRIVISTGAKRSGEISVLTPLPGDVFDGVVMGEAEKNQKS
jgi:hypothetical protein